MKVAYVFSTSGHTASYKLGKMILPQLEQGTHGVEVVGLTPPGEGASYWGEGRAAVDGDCAVNTSGGLIAKGHPIGATGVAMLGWATRQLTGRAPAPLQRRDAEVAATFNIGGPICASVCTVLRREA